MTARQRRFSFTVFLPLDGLPCENFLALCIRNYRLLGPSFPPLLIFRTGSVHIYLRRILRKHFIESESLFRLQPSNMIILGTCIMHCIYALYTLCVLEVAEELTIMKG